MMTKQSVVDTLDLFSTFCAEHIREEGPRDALLKSLSILEKQLNEGNKQYLQMINTLCTNMELIGTALGVDTSKTRELVDQINKESGYFS